MRRSAAARSIAFILLLVSVSAAQVAFDHQSYALGGNQLVRADFNNDGKPDLLVTGSGQMSVLLNDGHGGFGPPINYATIGDTGAAVLDFNRDGNVDVVACSDLPYPGTGSVVTMWEGGGNGTIMQTASFNNNMGCAGIVAGDFNGDGNRDFAVATSSYVLAYPNYTVNNELTVYFGDGAGHIANQVTSSGMTFTDSLGNPCAFVSLTAGDFNGDGKLDLVAGTEDYSPEYTVGNVQLGIGDANGHFTWSNIHEADYTYAVHAADVNQDGSLDVVADASGIYPHGSDASEVDMLLNQGSNTFKSAVVYGVNDYASSYSSQIYSGAAADLDGDGTKDAVIAYVYTPDDQNIPASPYLGVLMGKSDGTYGSVQNWSVAATPHAVITADFDRDGRTDIAVVTDNGLEVFLNRSTIAPTCPAQTGLRTVALCVPSTVAGPLHLLANSTDNRQINAMQVYIDGVKKFTTPDELINHVFSLPTGTHRITAKGWDDLGAFSATKYVNVTSAPPPPPPPGTCTGLTTNRTVTICTPAANSTTSSPVHITAAVTDSRSISAVKIYIDGVSKYQTTSKQVDTSLSMSAGSHRLTIKAWDSAGSFSQTENITVQ